MYICTSTEVVIHTALTNLEGSLQYTQVRQQTQLLPKSAMVWDINESDMRLTVHLQVALSKTHLTSSYTIKSGWVNMCI